MILNRKNAINSEAATHYTREQITPHCQALFTEVIRELPQSIAERLTCQRKVVNHGSYRTVLLFNIWDKNQSDVLPKKHFCYCLGYDPERLLNKTTDWYFHLWINTIRIYRDRLVNKAELEQHLQKLTPFPFSYYVDNRAVQSKISFDIKSLDQLVSYLKPIYVKLISNLHPVLIPIIDKYSIHGSRSDIKAEVASRGRIPHNHPGVANPDLVSEYSRSIPPTVRKALLVEYGYKCALCGTSLKTTTPHIDHKIPFTRGGKTVKENLQPLCPQCNLKKGNRV